MKRLMLPRNVDADKEGFPVKRHISIFALLLSAFAAVGAETITAQYVVKNGNFQTDGSVISPSSTTATSDRPAVFKVSKSNWPGYSLKWLWSEKNRQQVTSADDLTEIGAADEFRKISEENGTWICTVGYSGEGDHTLAVKLDYILLDVTFDGNGSTSGSMTPITGNNIDSAFALTANAYKKTGYQFLGWTNRVIVGTVFSDGATMKGSDFWNAATRSFDSTLYAKWGGTESTVTFNANYEGGSVTPSSKQVVYGAPYGELPEPERTGYTFEVWKTEKDGGTLVKADTIVTAMADHALWAQWKANTYTVMLEPDGGQISISEFKATFDQPYSRLPTAVKDGHEFSGWWTLPSGGTLVENNSLVETAADHVLYARYAPRTATVSFNPNGGRVGLSQKDVTFGAPYGDLPVPERDSTDRDGYYTTYEFKGWSLGGTIVTKDTIVSKSGNHTLDAVWLENRMPNQYTVSFDPNYDGAPSVPSKRVVYDSAYGNLPTLTRDDRDEGGYHYAYEFLGWFYGATEITEGTVLKIANDHTLTAHWKETKTAKVVTITFDRQGGFGGQATVEATYDKPLPALEGSALPVRTGYVFGGYWTAPQQGGVQYYYANGAGVRTCDLTDDTVLYARWTPISYKIVFNANGGSGYVDEMNLKYDEVKQLNPGDQKFTRPNYEFLGWSRDSSATAPEFSEHEEIRNLTDQDGATITMYAVWKAQTYTVAFDSNGATNVVRTQVIVRGVSTALASNEYAKTGYTFSGWAETQSNAVALVVKYKDREVVKDLAEQDKTNTLYAVWNTNAYYIAFAANGGTGSAPATKKAFYDQPWDLPWNTFVAPEHYEFAGWDFDRTASEPTFGDQERVVNLCAENGKTNMLYAIWKFVPSEISEVLDCNNLYFKKTEGSTEWTIVATNCGHHGVGPDSMRHIGEKGSVFAEAESSGTLSFCWSGETKKTGGIVNKARLVLSVDETVLETFEAVQDMKWSNVTVRIEHRTEGPVRIEFSHSGTSVGVYLDHVTWIPDGAEPTYAEDDTPVTGFSRTDGKLGFSFESDGSSTYHILGTNDVTAPWMSWPFVREIKPGETQPVQIDIKADEPKMFYRIRALK